jgi:hypothetical protein
VSPADHHIASRHLGAPLVFPGYTLPLANCQRVVGERATAPSRMWTARGDRTASALGTRVPPHWLVGRFPYWTGLPGQGPRGYLAGRAWQAATSSGRPTLCAFLKIHFSDLFNPKNGSKFLEFIEKCRNVQKLQTKFNMNSLEQVYTVGLINLIFVQSFIVQKLQEL